MKYLINSIIVLIVSISLLACNDKEKAVPKAQEEIYDFRNEKYQDFYSVFMRKVQQMDKDSINPNDGFEMSFDYQKIKQVLDIEPPNKNILFKLIIYRNNPNDKYVGMPTKYQNKEDIFAHRQQIGFQYQECSLEKQIDGLYCLDTDQLRYYYLPNQSKYKIKYINQSIDAYCNLNCRISNYPISPYNIEISIHFSNPKDFFYIIDYVERYFFKITGEHIWQTSLSKN